jgi:hypothetical protein
MVRNVLLLFGLCALSLLSARAQDKVGLFGGYSYMRFAGTNLNGWEVSGQFKFLDWLGGVADVDGHYGSFDGIGTSTYTFLFGPQISRPSRVSPFGHLLLGGAHTSTGGSGPHLSRWRSRAASTRTCPKGFIGAWCRWTTC